MRNLYLIIICICYLSCNYENEHNNLLPQTYELEETYLKKHGITTTIIYTIKPKVDITTISDYPINNNNNNKKVAQTKY